MPPSPLVVGTQDQQHVLQRTTNISAQKIVDTAPTMCGVSSGTPTPGLKISFIV